MNKKYINPKTGQKYGYYSPEGKGYENVLDWAKTFEPPKDKEARDKWFKETKVVKQENTWMGFWVSTVWLGLDHSFLPNQLPLIFETMVFFRSDCGLEMNRYTTKRQALAGHKEMVKKWSNPLYVIYKVIDYNTWSLQWKIDSLIRKIKGK